MWGRRLADVCPSSGAAEGGRARPPPAAFSPAAPPPSTACGRKTAPEDSEALAPSCPRCPGALTAACFAFTEEICPSPFGEPGEPAKIETKSEIALKKPIFKTATANGSVAECEGQGWCQRIAFVVSVKCREAPTSGLSAGGEGGARREARPWLSPQVDPPCENQDANRY